MKRSCREESKLLITYLALGNFEILKWDVLERFGVGICSVTLFLFIF